MGGAGRGIFGNADVGTEDAAHDVVVLAGLGPGRHDHRSQAQSKRCVVVRLELDHVVGSE